MFTQARSRSSRVSPRQVVYVRVPLSGSPDVEHLQAPRIARRLLAGVFSLLQVQNRSLDRIEDASVIAYEFDTQATLGRKTVAWFIDLPSNVLIAKAGVASHVAAAIERAKTTSGLPEPDFIVGDFNTPAGSASLNTYAPGFTDAASTAGFGLVATWPRPSSLLHIDHILVSPRCARPTTASSTSVPASTKPRPPSSGPLRRSNQHNRVRDTRA
ncbi:MAG: endonuclease/exonuclease/phosphatase family protein [Phycisphaerales bacterium]